MVVKQFLLTEAHSQSLEFVSVLQYLNHAKEFHIHTSYMADEVIEFAKVRNSSRVEVFSLSHY